MQIKIITIWINSCKDRYCLNEPQNKWHFRNVLPYCSKKMEGVKLRSIIMSLCAFHKSLAFKLLSQKAKDYTLFCQAFELWSVFSLKLWRKQSLTNKERCTCMTKQRINNVMQRQKGTNCAWKCLKRCLA